MNPFFSVIIPLYNKEKDVENTLKSVVSQSFSDFEVVVVNDGSIDNSASVVRSIKDDRIKLFETSNYGVSKCRNIAVEKSKGRYVAFLDADDYWYPNHLEEIHQLIVAFPQGKWFGAAYEIQHSNKLVLPMKCPPMQYGKSWIGEINDFFANSMVDCMAWTSAVCMAKEYFFKLGGYNTVYDSGEDIDLWIRAALESNFIFTNNITSRYILMASNRMTLRSNNEKNYMRIDDFEGQEKDNQSLKKYLDLIRYTYIYMYKLYGQEKKCKRLKRKIKMENMTFVQRIIISSPGIVLRLLYKIKNLLLIFNIRIRVARKYT